MNQYLPDWQPSKSRFVRLRLGTKCRHPSAIGFLVLTHISGACTHVQRYRVRWNSLGNLANTRAAWTTPSEDGLLQGRVSRGKDEFLTNRFYELGFKIIAKTGDVALWWRAELLLVIAVKVRRVLIADAE